MFKVSLPCQTSSTTRETSYVLLTSLSTTQPQHAITTQLNLRRKKILSLKFLDSLCASLGKILAARGEKTGPHTKGKSINGLCLELRQQAGRRPPSLWGNKGSFQLRAPCGHVLILLPRRDPSRALILEIQSGSGPIKEKAEYATTWVCLEDTVLSEISPPHKNKTKQNKNIL